MTLTFGLLDSGPSKDKRLLVLQKVYKFSKIKNTKLSHYKFLLNKKVLQSQ